jgi:hypothetical protein
MRSCSNESNRADSLEKAPFPSTTFNQSNLRALAPPEGKTIRLSITHNYKPTIVENFTFPTKRIIPLWNNRYDYIYAINRLKKDKFFYKNASFLGLRKVSKLPMDKCPLKPYATTSAGRQETIFRKTKNMTKFLQKTCIF